MHGIPTFIPFVLAIALASYGWWCSFRTPPRPNFLDHQEGVINGKDL